MPATDPEAFADLLVGQSIGDEPQHLAFALGQAVHGGGVRWWGEPLDEAAGQAGGEQFVPADGVERDAT